MSVEGVDGRFVLYPDRLEIRRKGVATLITRGMQRAEVYSIEDISGIEVSDPIKFVSRGSATVVLAGEYSSGPARHRAAADRNTILIGTAKAAVECRELNDAITQMRAEAGISEESVIAMVTGFDGQVRLFRDKIVITQKDKLLSKMTKGAVGVLEIPLLAITGVQLKKPGMTKGYIKFQAHGHFARQGGIFGAVQDEQSVTIANQAEYKEFIRFKKVLDAELNRTRTPSPQPAPDTAQFSKADELSKLAELFQQGLLTQDEFDDQKRRLLAQ